MKRMKRALRQEAKELKQLKAKAQPEERAFMMLVGDPDYEPSKLPKPTEATPGSLAKIDVLAQRAAMGAELWHPEDPVIRHKMSELTVGVTGYWGHVGRSQVVER